MPTKAKFKLTEAVVLGAARARRNGHVIPRPNEADAGSPKMVKLLSGMVAAGLLEERPTTSAKCVWRADPDGQHYLLRLTKLGRTAAGEAARPAEAAPVNASEPVSANAPKVDAPRPPAGKLGQVLSAVQSSSGASIGDLITLTGWQPHTVRASLTRLRQTGVTILLTGDDGHKRYTIAQTAEAPGR